MTAPASPPPSADFLQVAADLGFVAAERLPELRRDCTASGQAPALFAAQKGLLGAVEIDIVETLRTPLDAVPGFRVEGLIGKGGMGVVYRAEQLALGRAVALKTILVSRMADRGVLGRFELEARSIGQLRHPNIIAAHDFGRQGGRLFLAMELVEGTDLDRRIKAEGRLGERLVWGLIRQAASGLAHAAQQRIVHRDIKPANLMLVEPPEGYPLPAGLPMVKIADFGLALLDRELPVDDRLTAPDATVGSPHYMAPEQLESSHVDHRADIYALGATAFHALTGRPPFVGLNLSQLIAAKMKSAAPAIETVCGDLSASTCALVGRMLARDPSQRPADYRELLADIDDVLATISGAAEPALQETDVPDLPRSREGVTAQLQTVQTLLEQDLASAAAQPSRGDSRPRTGKRRLIAAAAAVGLLAATAWHFVVNRPAPLPTSRGARTLVGDAAALFNGETLDGWTTEFGLWGAAANEPILTGRDGAITRVLPLLSRLGLSIADRPDGPPPFYRLDLIQRGLDSGERAEVHFGVSRTNGDSPERYVLRRTEAGFDVGAQSGDRGEFVPEVRIARRALAPTEAAAIEIERLPAGWFIDINGEPFGALPLEPRPLPEFRLAAVGEVEFAELYLQTLQPGESPDRTPAP